MDKLRSSAKMTRNFIVMTLFVIAIPFERHQVTGFRGASDA